MKNKFLLTAICGFVALTCLGMLCGCAKTYCDAPQVDETQQSISFGKKYYVLQNNGCNKNQYYIFNKDGTATCDITLTDGDEVTYQAEINMRWFDGGNGQYILLHNGTQILHGKQDLVFGFGGVARITTCTMQWDNAYYICEDCLDTIPNYAQFVTE